MTQPDMDEVHVECISGSVKIAFTDEIATDIPKNHDLLGKILTKARRSRGTYWVWQPATGIGTDANFLFFISFYHLYLSSVLVLTIFRFPIRYLHHDITHVFHVSLLAMPHFVSFQLYAYMDFSKLFPSFCLLVWFLFLPFLLYIYNSYPELW